MVSGHWLLVVVVRGVLVGWLLVIGWLVGWLVGVAVGVAVAVAVAVVGVVAVVDVNDNSDNRQ